MSHGLPRGCGGSVIDLIIQRSPNSMESGAAIHRLVVLLGFLLFFWMGGGDENGVLGRAFDESKNSRTYNGTKSSGKTLQGEFVIPRKPIAIHSKPPSTKLRSILKKIRTRRKSIDDSSFLSTPDLDFNLSPAGIKVAAEYSNGSYLNKSKANSVSTTNNTGGGDGFMEYDDGYSIQRVERVHYKNPCSVMAIAFLDHIQIFSSLNRLERALNYNITTFPELMSISNQKKSIVVYLWSTVTLIIVGVLAMLTMLFFGIMIGLMMYRYCQCCHSGGFCKNTSERSLIA